MESIGGETIKYFLSIPITNTLITVFIADIIIVLIAFTIRKNISIIPNKIQNIFEFAYDFVYNLSKSVLPKKYLNRLVPIIFTFFFFILINNWFGLLPGMDSIKTSVDVGSGLQEVSLLKGASADLNVTLALATCSFLLVHISTIMLKGFKAWIKHFLHTKPIYFLFIYIPLAILELCLNPLSYLSLSLRLFGNIMAGEVLINSMMTFPGLAVPFLLLEVLVGALQALIFTGLTLAFLGTMLNEEKEEEKEFKEITEVTEVTA